MKSLYIYVNQQGYLMLLLQFKQWEHISHVGWAVFSAHQIYDFRKGLKSTVEIPPMSG